MLKIKQWHLLMNKNNVLGDSGWLISYNSTVFYPMVEDMLIMLN